MDIGIKLWDSKSNQNLPAAGPDMDAIDIHTHIVPADFPAYAGRHAESRWPQMEACADCRHKNVMIAGKNFRTVSDECWNTERRVEAMAKAGITRQVLSPMPELLSYWFAPDDALAFGRHVNDTIAAMIDQAPNAFSGLGMVPLQDPELAARELERLMREGVLRGVEIGSNVNGVPIGDPRFEPFFAAAEELGAAVFVHALHSVGADRIVGPSRLMNFIAFPCETSFAIASMMTGGILERHPRLRLAFNHGGGAFALVLPRFQFCWGVVPSMKESMRTSPSDLAKRLYYDTLVYDAQTLGFLAECFGKRQLCLGTDFPFEIQEPAPLAALDALALEDDDRRLLQYENAMRFLGGRA